MTRTLMTTIVSAIACCASLALAQDKDSDVERLQQSLLDNGFYSGETSGIMDLATETAFADFWSDKGLKLDRINIEKQGSYYWSYMIWFFKPRQFALLQTDRNCSSDSDDVIAAASAIDPTQEHLSGNTDDLRILEGTINGFPVLFMDETRFCTLAWQLHKDSVAVTLSGSPVYDLRRAGQVATVSNNELVLRDGTTVGYPIMETLDLAGL